MTKPVLSSGDPNHPMPDWTSEKEEELDTAIESILKSKQKPLMPTKSIKRPRPKGEVMMSKGDSKQAGYTSNNYHEYIVH